MCAWRKRLKKKKTKARLDIHLKRKKNNDDK